MDLDATSVAVGAIAMGLAYTFGLMVTVTVAAFRHKGKLW